MKQLTKSRYNEVKVLQEFKQRDLFRQYLQGKVQQQQHLEKQIISNSHSSSIGINNKQSRVLLQSSLSTFLLHIQARIASLVGAGYYTIGPCGEETTSVFGLMLQQHDPSALHYRHLAATISRQLMHGNDIKNILLDRARGYTCSIYDPVSGGTHCAIGSNGNRDYYVTSTLASQCPQAVGRALGHSLSKSLGFNGFLSKDAMNDNEESSKRIVSFVTIGDGSVNNAAFLGSLNLAAYVTYRKRKCPVLFGISDNDICISLKGQKWLNEFSKTAIAPRMNLFRVENGTDIREVWKESKKAFDYVREQQKPACLIISNLPRRFGHAATDRQSVYMSENEIMKQANDARSLESVCDLAIETSAYSSYKEILDEYERIENMIEDAFEQAITEPKITSREDMLNRVSAPEWIPHSSPSTMTTKMNDKNKTPTVMRKIMTESLQQALKSNKSLVYIGEDVEHGGYYLVTEGLSKQYPGRVLDFPPDETSIVGCGIGFSQAGLLPIVEMPYAKYLDMAADQFFEACILHWCTNGKQPNGMIIRLQGFGRGVFGGNFHTHNMIYLPPGLDVVCFSNGHDWSKGFRYLLKQAQSGRVVMLIDPTDLLNRRHIDAQKGDNKWLTPISNEEEDGYLSFDDIIIYDKHGNRMKSIEKEKNKETLLIVSWGNGVPLSLETTLKMDDKDIDIYVIDTPCLSRVPNALKTLLKSLNEDKTKIVFADDAKIGQNPYANYVQQLQAEKILPKNWIIVGAQPTYNPLGRTLTFLSVNDISKAIKDVRRQ